MNEALLERAASNDQALLTAIRGATLTAAGWAPSLADPEAFRAAVHGLGMSVNSAGPALGALPRTVRRYASRDPTAHRAPPRTLEILIAVLAIIR